MNKRTACLLIALAIPFLAGAGEPASAASRPAPFTQEGSVPGKEKGKKKKEVKKEKPKTESSYAWEFFAGPDLSFGFPVGKIRDSVNNGMGFQVRGEYFLMPQLNVGISTGYKAFKYDRVLVGEGHFSYIPVRLTGTWYFAEESFRPYASLGLGLYLTKAKYDADFWTLVRNPVTNRLDTLHEVKSLDEKQNTFGINPSVGILYNITDEFFLNLNLSYEFILTENKASNILGINLGLIYRFGF